MRSKNALLSLAASLVLGSTALADGATLSLDFAQYEPDQEILLTLTGEPGDVAHLLASNGAATVVLPGLATLGVDLGAGLQILNLGYIPASGVLTATCDLSCGSPLLEAPCFLQVVTIDPADAGLCVTEVVVLSGAASDCGLCPADPQPDAALTASDRDFGLRLAGLGALENFRFAGGGEFAEFGDGSASVTGILVAVDDADCKLYLDLDLELRVNPLDASYPPAGSPVQDLFPGAYEQNGGPIDTDLWHYYIVTRGTAEGLGGDCLGARLDFFPGATPAQVGQGANGLNGGYGLSADLAWRVDTQPTTGTTLGAEGMGDIAIDVGTCPMGDDGPICVTYAEAGGQYCTSGDHAVWFAELGAYWRFVGGTGDLFEAPDGTATLSGEIYNTQSPNQRFCVDVFLSGLVEPGDANYPPAGSPKLGLCDNLYASHGGPVDPSTFHYYTETTGVLIGKGDFDCAVVAIERKGPSFQIGVGANVKNANYGLSGWFDMTVLEQPCNGPHISDKNGDFNVDIVSCPTQVPNSLDPISHWDFEDQAGDKVVDRAGNMNLWLDEGHEHLNWVVDGHGRGIEFDQDASGDACIRTSSTGDATWMREAIQSSGEFTVQVAFQLDGQAHSYARLVSFSSGTALADRNFSLHAFPNGSPSMDTEYRLVSSSGVHHPKIGLSNSFKLGDLIVLAMCYDGEGVLRASVDGVKIASWNVGGDLSVWTDRMFQIGNESTENRAFAGVIYDVKIWNRPLSDAELQAESAGLHAGA
ncbi:LamG-like jellyroll fold domain-containing protein [Engelhardtia mirabilis]|uniref:LamG-like jellyroll fold domain-containing protein n=1 Tax=Engelhardtia mirabilis TaxID=2528011 RepID=A0A518BIV1_9BACT|nr:hypothetical protein Pla133_19870 [Planctomycetes bacterium Pla133]QDV01238.1 hypothetical protein Pla86_19870 [Planctomycetes bacterium Pla86]